ncbi:zf-HC2 domain-containing protein [Haliangium sp.]|uniref:anti-sigma factor family protein n=1 Tax=Haliangium sp. TaxID=2663208 RepID=UPI003D128F8B
MADCQHYDGLVVDWLYDELAPSEREAFAGHIAACASCRAQVESLAQIRSMMSAVSVEEPPAALSNQILHQAAKQVAARPSWWARMGAWFELLSAHPGLAAMATMVLVLGVAGVLIIGGRSDEMLSEPIAERAAASAAPAKESKDVDRETTVEKTGAVASEDDDRPEGGSGGETITAELDEALSGANGLSASPNDPSPGDSASMPQGRASARLKKQAPAEQSYRADNKRARNAGARDKLAQGFGDDDLFDQDPAPRQQRSRPRSAADMSAAGPASNLMVGGSTAPTPAQAPAPSPSRALGAEEQAQLPPPPPQAAPTPQPRPATRRPAARKPAEDENASESKKSEDAGWAKATRGELISALARGRCGQASRLADAIQTRDSDYYRREVAGLKGLKECQQRLAAERKRRSEKQAARKAKAADDAAAEEAASEPAADSE